MNADMLKNHPNARSAESRIMAGAMAYESRRIVKWATFASLGAYGLGLLTGIALIHEPAPVRTLPKPIPVEVPVAATSGEPTPTRTIRDLFEAIAEVESSGDPRAIGDGGRSLGLYQIGRDYWLDSGVPGHWEDCYEPEYAERVMLAYWARYEPAALETLDFETLARVHNGGPNGERKNSTIVYWGCVQEAMP